MSRFDTRLLLRANMAFGLLARPIVRQSLAAVIIVNIAFALVIYLSGFLFGTPKLVMDRTTLDFGIVPSDVVVSRALKLTNVGNSDLIISRLQGGCGCTAARLSPDGPILPGNSATIEVSLKLEDTAAQSGKVTNVYIFSNDPGQPVAVITAAARSAHGELARPDFIDFGRISKREKLPLHREVVLGDQGDVARSKLHDFVIEVPIGHEYIAAKPIDSSEKGSRFSVSLMSDAPSGDFCLDLLYRVVSTDLRGRIRVRGHISGEYVAIPQMVVFGPIFPGDEPVSKLVQISSKASKHALETKSTTHITKVDLSKELKGIISFKTAQEENGIFVKLTISPRDFSGTWSDHSVLGRIVFHLTGADGRQDVLNLPIAVTTQMQRIHADAG